MTGALPSTRVARAIRRGCAAAALFSAAPAAAADIDLFSRDTLEITGIARLVATTGETSWVDGGFGKLAANGGGDDLRIRPQLGEANLIWTPQLGWAVSATIVGTFQGGDRNEAGISQAFLSYRPMRSDKFGFSGRAGLMWPPVSLEHEGADWHVIDTITPSAINSWIGEEIRPAAIEATADFDVGAHQLLATAAVFAANDTAGTLLSFRGWALHDRKTLAFQRQPLPEVDHYTYYQAPFTHPLIDLHRGFAHRPGYYAKLAWQPPAPVRLELFRYDNRADPEDVNRDVEWGWRSWFNHVALVADLGQATQLKLQAIDGRTRMGFVEADRRWVDTRFRSAFLLLTRAIGQYGVAARLDAFETGNRGSFLGDEHGDRGWAATVAAKRDWGSLTGLIELLHVASRREDREAIGLRPKQRQTQIQANLRLRW